MSIYLLKIKQVETVRHLAVLMGKTERTIHRWLKLYREGGIEELLAERQSTGRSKLTSLGQFLRFKREIKTQLS
ncbi:MAG: helix-turn-helix domain-containing protein [Symploca sp. SIO1B1]|nr:helix-turn-helix domain-containing protein [Symploca sp. SIO1B1]